MLLCHQCSAQITLEMLDVYKLCMCLVCFTSHAFMVWRRVCLGESGTFGWWAHEKCMEEPTGIGLVTLAAVSSEPGKTNIAVWGHTSHAIGLAKNMASHECYSPLLLDGLLQ